MAGRPTLTPGYLGAQAKFEEFGFSVLSHDNPDITLDSNQIDVKIRFSKPIKVTANLTNCARSEEMPQHVMTQTEGNVITFTASLPETGYYKLQIFGLLLPDESKQLLGVYNYLINCTTVVHPANVYPKQFAQWKEGCFIREPVSLTKDSNLSNVRFVAHAPNALSAAVVAEGEWTQLKKNAEGLWEGCVCLDQYKGKDSKVTLNANYGDDNKFSTLLEYRV